MYKRQSDFHPVLNRLDGMDPADHAVWRTRYVLLLWMSLIAMLPFDMTVLDAGGAEPDVDRMLRLCKVYLGATDKARDGAAVLLATSKAARTARWASDRILAAKSRAPQKRVAGTLGSAWKQLTKRSTVEARTRGSSAFFSLARRKWMLVTLLTCMRCL